MAEGLFSVTDFGADAGSASPATEAFQKAVDACHKSGGGVVSVPPGSYALGTVELRSHVNLHLPAGARIVGSREVDDYGTYDRSGGRKGILFAEDAQDIALTGHGEICGSGSAFMDPDRYRDTPDYEARFTRQGAAYPSPAAPPEDGPIDFDDRPGKMIVLVDCENVRLSDLTLTDSPSWTVRLATCEDVGVRGLTIRNNPLIANSDGIHATTSRDVRISDCAIRGGDDAVCVTGFGSETLRRSGAEPKHGNRGRVAERVVVNNCILSSRSSGVRVGHGKNDVRDCLFQNLSIYDSNRGLGVFVRNAGSVENVLFSNAIVRTRLMAGNWWGRGEPIHLSALRGPDTTGPLGGIRNVRFTNVVAAGESGIVLYGTEESVIEDLLLSDVKLSLIPGEHLEAWGGNFDLRPAAEREKAVFRHDIPALHAEHVDGLTLRNCAVSCQAGLPGYYSAAFRGHHVTGLSVHACAGPLEFT